MPPSGQAILDYTRIETEQAKWNKPVNSILIWPESKTLGMKKELKEGKRDGRREG